MASESDPNVWEKVVGGLLAGLAALGALIWRGQNEKIGEVREIAAAALPRKEFERHLTDSLQDRQNLRADVKELFGRHDDLKDMLHHQTSELKDYVRDQFDALRRDLKP